MPQVYVIGALIPRGGAYMAYQIGRILQQEFGYRLVAVQMGGAPESSPFSYDPMPEAVTLAQMERTITASDLLVVNPSFSRHLFGTRLPGRKICYAQGFQTFQALDCGFDLYVSVSSVVQRFLASVYGIATDVIPPFIEQGAGRGALPWHERPAGSAMMYVKAGEENLAAANYLQAPLRSLLAHLSIHHAARSPLSHAEFLERLGAVRYLINVSLAEGFGLVPLEAMMMGTCVAGLNGLAGDDYMRHGENSLCYAPRDLQKIPAAVARLASDEAFAQSLSRQGQSDAARYGEPAFRAAWVAALRRFLS